MASIGRDGEPRGGRIERIVVINDYAVAEGGAGVLALLAARQYRRLGYPVTFITGQADNAELEAHGVEVVGLGSKGLLELPASRALRQGFHNSEAERLVTGWIARHDTPGTVYHLHNWSQILSPAIFRALRPVEERTVVTCHDFFNACPNGGFLHYGKSEPCELRPLSPGCLLSQCDRRNALHKYWRAARQRHLTKLARFAESHCTFTFIHERMREKFVHSGFPAKDLVAIPNPAEPWSRERIGAEANAGFLFVGRIGRDKGADIALVGARRAGQRVTMIGTGELQQSLAASYPEAEFAGWCDRDAILAHARRARGLIVPSRVIEPFGLVICEAALSGIPVIVSDRAYLAEEVEAMGIGRSFAVTDIDRLAAILAIDFADDRAVEAMSRAAFEAAASLCNSPESWIAAFIEIFVRKVQRAACNAPS